MKHVIKAAWAWALRPYQMWQARRRQDEARGIAAYWTGKGCPNTAAVWTEQADLLRKRTTQLEARSAT